MDKDFILTQVNDLHLPARFEHKLKNDLQYLLSLNIPDIKQIILFGSCARNTPRITSDLDLLIITVTAVDRMLRGEISSELEEAIDHVSTDVIFYTLEQFMTSNCLIVTEIKKEGILLYEK